MKEFIALLIVAFVAIFIWVFGFLAFCGFIVWVGVSFYISQKIAEFIESTSRRD